MYFERQLKVGLFSYKDVKQNYKHTKAFVTVILVVNVAGFRSTQKSFTVHPEVCFYSVCRQRGLTKGGRAPLNPIPSLLSSMR